MHVDTPIRLAPRTGGDDSSASCRPGVEPRTRTARRAGITIVALVAVATLLAACGDDDDAATTTEATTTSATGSDVIEVRAIDFAYEDLPATVGTGTTLSLHNDSTVEVHEIVAFRLPDEEQRTVDELLALPDEETDQLFAGEPALVALAPPGEDGFVVVGDGTLSEPGRYVVLCAIPIGADPDEYMRAAADPAGGPPSVAGGPPHFVSGMVAELTVQD